MTLSVRRLSSTAVILIAVSLPVSATAADTAMPPVKISNTNQVADCATPGRLMAFLKDRNPTLNEKFETVAKAYQSAGQQLGIRWDYGFFQMLVETGFLTFKGTVKPDQNNFAGIGATGGGVRGESFKDVETGARAHLEHLAMYAGDKLENPTAERTRLVMDQGVLTKWQKTISGPMTFTHLTKQWAPTSKGYAGDIKNVAERFFNGACKSDDPNPALVATAAPKAEPIQAAAVEPAAVTIDPTVGDQLAKKANDDARADGGVKSGLGAGSLADVAEAQQPVMPVKILNAAPTEAPVAAVAPVVTPPIAGASPAVTAPQSGSLLASLSAFGKSIMSPTPTAEAPKIEGSLPTVKDAKVETPAGKCRVFTASYGGAKSVIVKAVLDKQVNYTVLDVNEGSEKREAEAYISAYAKGGETVGGDFKSQDTALDKAFELCPEG
jgi:Mannosyl-glycoprotein endo-beta-N-acetylglucosaminidase